MSEGIHNDGQDGPLEFALRYAISGLSVVPIACDGTKQPPAGQSWKHLQAAIASEDEIRRMWSQRRGIAVICGKVSGNLESLDIDQPELVEPLEAALRELAPGLLERLCTVATPRNDWGGRHYRYRIEGTVAGNTKLALSKPLPQVNDDGTPLLDPKTGNQRIAPNTLIETRGEGGYALVPGSPPECHETNLPYKHISGPPLTELATITAEEHALLMRVARSFNEYVDHREVKDAPTSTGDGESPGDAFNARASWDEILQPAGWTVVEKRGAINLWRRPGKSKGVSATTGIRSSAGSELLCVFSSNAHPLEGPANGRICSSYSKFAAYSLLNHNGDFSAAAKELATRGYGRPARKSAAKPAPRIVTPDPFRPFPVDVLPRVCAEFVRQAAASIDCDPSMVAVPLLGAIAAAIGNSCRIQLKRDYSEPAIIWAAVVSESGSRKSPAVECPVRALKRKEGEEIKQYNSAMADYAVDMHKHRAALKRKKGGEDLPLAEPRRPVCRRFTVSDVTTEALAVRLEQNPRGLLLFRDELAGFFNCMNQYKSGGKGGDEAAYLAMHGARSLVIDRKNPEKPQIFVPAASLSIVGAIQPGVLRRVLTRDRMESGMAARFLMTYPPARTAKWSEKALDQSVDDRLSAMFDWLLALPVKFDEKTQDPLPALLPLTSEAKQLWIDFHDEHAAKQAQLHGDLSAAWAKLIGYAARLSLVCHLAAWASESDDFEVPPAVDAKAVQVGITLARWFSDETKRIYAILDETDEQREIRELVEYVRQQGGSVTARHLSRGPRRYRNAPELAELDLQRLAAHQLGEWVTMPSGQFGGRPTRAFQLFADPTHDETPSPPVKSEGFVAVATEKEGRCPGEGGKE